MTSKRLVRSSLYFVGICVAALGLSVTRGQEQRANGRQSAAALKAESDYQDALAAAEKEYFAKAKVAQARFLKELEKAKDAATKAKDLDAAVAIRNRLTELEEFPAAAPERKRTPQALAREKLSQQIVNATWGGSPNWGRFILKIDGTLTLENTVDGSKVMHWIPVDTDTICSVHPGGFIDLLQFDADRKTVKAFHVGRFGNPSWQASRQK